MTIDAQDTAAETSPQDRLAARYRDPPWARTLALPQWNEVLDTLLAHRSVRSYSDQPLPEGLLETLVAAAQSAPSSSNLQAWSVVAVQDPERKARLATLAAGQRHVARAPLLLLFVADQSVLRAVSRQHGYAAEGLDYLEAFIIALADASFAAQNLLTAAESLGLGGCYIGAMRNRAKEVADELGLPDDAFVVFGMTLGYPDPGVETEVKPRLPQSIVLHHERYSPPAPEALEAYDERMRGFRTDQRMSDIDWTEQAARRIKDKAALTGRDVLHAMLQARGFGLR